MRLLCTGVRKIIYAQLTYTAADTFTTGGSNSAKDQAKENGSLAWRTLSLRYPKNKVGLSKEAYILRLHIRGI